MKRNPIVEKLRSKSQKTIIIKDDEFGESTWVVRQISSLELIEKSAMFSSDISESDVKVSKDDPDSVTPETIELVRNNVLPLMKEFLPICCINPRVTLDPEDPMLQNLDTNTLLMNDIPLNMASQIFNEILSISGLTEKAQDDKKKLPEVNSVQQ